MLARSITLTHPGGSLCHTPLLVPSFSSKGFDYVRLEQDSHSRRSRQKRVISSTGTSASGLVSMASVHLQKTVAFIDESLLISAYDIHFKLIEKPFRGLRQKSLVLVDSGGYELAPEYDSADPKHFEYRPRRGYGLRQYRAVLDAIPKDIPCVITNFDHSAHQASVAAQVDGARELFADYPQFMTNFLLKPSPDRNGDAARFLDLKRQVRPELDSFRHFNILGVTEKELGATLLQKLETLAGLRVAMDEVGMQNTPIHLWGGLDPIITPLFMMAGASIFDGVSWLRYAFHDGMAVSWDAGSVLQNRLAKSELADAITVGNNLAALLTLASELRRFVQSGCADFTVFGTRGPLFKSACEAMQGAQLAGFRNSTSLATKDGR